MLQMLILGKVAGASGLLALKAFYSRIPCLECSLQVGGGEAYPVGTLDC